MAEYENRQALREAVEKRLGRALSDGEWIGVEPTWDPSYGEADVKEILDTLKEQDIQPTTRDPLEVARLKMRLRAEQDAERQGKSIPGIRQDIFGDPEAPFPDDLKAAREWIEAKAREQGGEWLGELEYVCEDRWVRKVRVPKGTRLARLWRHASGMNRLLGWHQCEVVRWILTGSWEPPSPIAYSWAPGVEYTVTVRSPDVPIESVKELAKELREAVFGRRRAEGAKEGLEDSIKRAMTLVEFVEREMRFRDLLRSNETWWQWLEKWNRRYSQHGWGFDYPDAMRMAYNRAKKRIIK